MSTREVPDVLGWRIRTKSDHLDDFPYDTMDSVLFECKASRADFLADQKKPHRIAYGYGRFRYFFAPEGVIREHELPPLWGLIIIKNGKPVRVVKAQYFDGPDVLRKEILLLRAIAQEHERMITSPPSPL